MIRILVISNDRLARAGLASMLAIEEGFEVAASVGGDVALDVAIEAYAPDVIVRDGTIEELRPAIEEAGLGGAGSDPLPIVLLVPDGATTSGWHDVSRALLSRDADAGAIAAAVTAVARGLALFDPSIVTLPSMSESLDAGIEEMLTARELEVITLLADGLSNKLIADRLGISEHTVKFHVNAILGKLGAHTRTEAVTRAARNGLINL